MHTATITKGEKSTVTIDGEIPYADLEHYRKDALKELGKNVSIDGFRKGHIPEATLIKHIGEMALLSEMAERALAVAYPTIVNEHKLDVVGRPDVSITKLAQDNPLGFSMTVSVMPDVTLPDYRKIASEIKKESPEVGEKEIDEAIENIMRQKIAYERMQKKAASKKENGEELTLPTPETVEKESDEEEPLPALTDEYVKTLGEFDTVTAFKEKMREHLSIEKEKEVTAKHRAAITDAVIAKSEIDLPEVFIESELNQMFAQMESDLTRAQLSIDDYLTHIKKTKEDLAAEWRPAAEKRAKLQLVLNEIAKKEEITAPKDKVEQEVDGLLEQYKDADPARVHLYVSSMLTNDEVMAMLEKESAVTK